MSERKVVGRSIAIGLGTICVILIAGLFGIFAYYWMQANTLSDEKNALTNYKSKLETWLAGNITQLQSQRDSLQSDHNSYVASHHHTDSEYDSLQNQINVARAPKLVKVNFGASDNRPWFGTPYLNINGVLMNVGSNTAYTCRLHVILYQSGGAIAKDTYINLGSINGESWTNVNTNVYYEGSGLTGWSVTPEWAS